MLLVILKLTQVELVLGREEAELLLLLGLQLVNVNGLQVHEELFEEAHGARGILVLVLAQRVLIWLS